MPYSRGFIAGLLMRLLATARHRILLEMCAWFVGVWWGSAWLILWFESDSNPRMGDLPGAVYQLLVTMTTSGDAAVVPVTVGGRFVMGVALILSKLLTALLCALAAAVVIERKVKEEMGLKMHKLDKHVVLVGWNLKGPRLIATLRAAPGGAALPIVVMADLESKPVEDPLVFFTRAPNPIRGEALARACLASAATVVALADYNERQHADALTAVNCMLARQANAGARIIAELLDPAQRPFLDAAGADDVVGIGEVGGYLLAEAAIGNVQARQLLATVAATASRPAMGIGGPEPLVCAPRA